MLFKQANYVRERHGFYGRFGARCSAGFANQFGIGIASQFHDAFQRAQHTFEASRSPRQGCVIPSNEQTYSSHFQSIIVKFIPLSFSGAAGRVHAPVWQETGLL